MSNYNRLIIINSIFTVAQILTVSLVYFFLYKLLIQVLGLELFGLWSLIFAISSVSSIGDLGMGGAVIKYSAEFQLKERYSTLNSLVNLAFLMVFVFLVLVTGLIYAGANEFIGFFVKEEFVNIGLEVIPITLFSVLLNVLAGIYFSVLIGFNRSFYRAISVIISILLYWLLAYLWVGEYGIFGLAYANLAQTALNFILSVIFLISIYPRYSFLRLHWDPSLMKEVIDYSVKFQTIGMINMLFEPVTKALLSKYTGLDFVGIYELANKLVLQVRSISSGIIMNFVPKIVRNDVNYGRENILSIYKKINSINSILLWTFLMSLIPFAYLISIFILETINSTFIICLAIVTLGWMINSLNISAYTINIGTGKLKWNLISHIIITVLNAVFLIYIGSQYEDGIGMLIGSGIALIIGSSVIIFQFHYEYKISFSDFIDTHYLKIALFYTLFLAATWWISEESMPLFIKFVLALIFMGAYGSIIVFSIKEFRENLEELIFLLFKKEVHLPRMGKFN